MGSPPTGVVTFLFTDIEGSTRMWERHPHQMRASLAVHDGLLRTGFEHHRGYVFGVLGDGFAVAFASPISAVEAAVDVQAALRETRWPHDEELLVRIAIDTGVADERDDEYYGSALNRLERLMKLIDGGSSVVTGTTARLVHDYLGPGIRLGRRRVVEVEDLADPVELLEIVPDHAARTPSRSGFGSFHGDTERAPTDPDRSPRR